MFVLLINFNLSISLGGTRGPGRLSGVGTQEVKCITQNMLHVDLPCLFENTTKLYVIINFMLSLWCYYLRSLEQNQFAPNAYAD